MGNEFDSLLLIRKNGDALLRNHLEPTLQIGSMYIDVDHRGIYSIMELSSDDLNLLHQALSAYVQSHLGRIDHHDGLRIKTFDQHFKRLIQNEKKRQTMDIQ